MIFISEVDDGRRNRLLTKIRQILLKDMSCDEKLAIVSKDARFLSEMEN